MVIDEMVFHEAGSQSPNRNITLATAAAIRQSADRCATGA